MPGSVPCSAQRSRRQKAFTLIELLVAIGIITVLIALLLPAMRQAREEARKVGCRNNLMQIGLALQNYAMAHDVLPSGVVNPEGPIRSEPEGYHVGWTVQILPFIDAVNVFEHLDFGRSVYDGANSEPRSEQMPVLMCPSNFVDGPPELGHSNYAGCHHDAESPIAADNTGVLFLNSSVTFREIRDGTSNTIFVGEKVLDGDGQGWASGTRATLRNAGTPINGGQWSPSGNFGRTAVEPDDDDAARLLEVGGFSSGHPGGAHFVTGDGAVRFIRFTIAEEVYLRLANRADGGMVGGF